MKMKISYKNNSNINNNDNNNNNNNNSEEFLPIFREANRAAIILATNNKSNPATYNINENISESY